MIRFIIADIADAPDYTNIYSSDRLVMSSKYIPKRLLKRVQQMEQEKAGVREILGVLGVVIG